MMIFVDGRKFSVKQVYIFSEKEMLMASKPAVSLSVEQIVEEIAPNPAAVVMQFLLLYKRNLLTAKRFYVSIFFLKSIIIYIISIK